ncbi:MAG: hypothetical protein HYU51_14955 [Candidatus Rokubacteria bacterium]|nr:hypothetical protein [Candidatus Rokubacteria bacterium]
MGHLILETKVFKNGNMNVWYACGVFEKMLKGEPFEITRWRPFRSGDCKDCVKAIKAGK